MINDQFLFQLLFEDLDPRGFLAPVTLQGKLIMKKLMTETSGWDQSLPDESGSVWQSWRESLMCLDSFRINRSYVENPEMSARKELHVYCNASERAIAAVTYLHTMDLKNRCRFGFMLGKAKVAPKSGHTIPRLE